MKIKESASYQQKLKDSIQTEAVYIKQMHKIAKQRDFVEGKIKVIEKVKEQLEL